MTNTTRTVETSEIKVLQSAYDVWCIARSSNVTSHIVDLTWELFIDIGQHLLGARQIDVLALRLSDGRSADVESYLLDIPGLLVPGPRCPHGVGQWENRKCVPCWDSLVRIFDIKT